MPSPGPLAVLLVAAFLLAGCAEPVPDTGTPQGGTATPPASSAPPAAANGSTNTFCAEGGFCMEMMEIGEGFPGLNEYPAGEVSLHSEAASAAPGQYVSFRWAANTSAEPDVPRAQLRYGSNASTTPSSDAYPHVVAAEFRIAYEKAAEWESSFPMPATPIYVRAVVLLADAELWSDEVRVELDGQGHALFLGTPLQIHAGAPFSLRVGVSPAPPDGFVGISVARREGETTLSGVDFTPGSERLDPIIVDLTNGTASPNVTLHAVGSWYLRAVLHDAIVNPYTGKRFVGSPRAGGEEIRVEAAAPPTPNLVLLTYDGVDSSCFELFAVCSGEVRKADVAYNAPAGASPVGIELVAFTKPTTAPLTSDGQVIGRIDNVEPGRMGIDFVLAEGTWHVRAHAVIAGQDVWSDDLRIRAVAP